MIKIQIYGTINPKKFQFELNPEETQFEAEYFADFLRNELKNEINSLRAEYGIEIESQISFSINQSLPDTMYLDISGSVGDGPKLNLSLIFDKRVVAINGDLIKKEITDRLKSVKEYALNLYMDEIKLLK
jgi:hypothetical protein